MEDEGLSAYYDEVGNLFGTLKGKSFKDETIMTGSHVDTVKNGGIYDGQFGIVAGNSLFTLDIRHTDKNGDIDIISSDHSPCLPGLKDMSVGKNFFDVWRGISSAQSTLNVFLEEGYWRRRFTPL